MSMWSQKNVQEDGSGDPKNVQADGRGDLSQEPLTRVASRGERGWEGMREIEVTNEGFVHTILIWLEILMTVKAEEGKRKERRREKKRALSSWIIKDTSPFW